MNQSCFTVLFSSDNKVIHAKCSATFKWSVNTDVYKHLLFLCCLSYNINCLLLIHCNDVYRIHLAVVVSGQSLETHTITCFNVFVHTNEKQFLKDGSPCGMSLIIRVGPQISVIHQSWRWNTLQICPCWDSTQVRISAWAYLKAVSSLTSLHYLWPALGPFSLPCAQTWL